MTLATELSREERDTLQRLEEELWREETRFDPGRMNEIIAADFFEFGRSGRLYRRVDTLSISRQPINARLPLQDFHARLLAPDVAQLTYNSAVEFDGYMRTRAPSSIRRGTPMAGCGGFKGTRLPVTPIIRSI
jgi:hypothetical protein